MPFPSTEDAFVMLQQLGIKVILNLTEYLDDAPLLSAFNVYNIPMTRLTTLYVTHAFFTTISWRLCLLVRLTRIANRARESLKEASLLVIQVCGKNYRNLGIEITALVWLSQLWHTLPA